METATTPTPTRKTCTGCRVEKSLSEFHRNRSRKDGYQSQCRECMLVYREGRITRLRNRADHDIEYPDGKWCFDCGDTKPTSEFAKNRGRLDGLTSRCKLCARWNKVQRRYGLSRSEWEDMWEEQGGRCAICQEMMERDTTGQDPLRAVVDHHPERSGPGCHRALLHNICNLLLPEDPETLRRMAVYVEAGAEALLPDELNNDTLDTLFGHLSKDQTGWRWRDIRGKYKVEPEKWLDMWNRQAGRCPCCQEPMEASSEKYNPLAAVVDHCHAGDQVRALLDHECNRTLGVFKDDPAVFRRAARYLELGAGGPVDVDRLDADNPLAS